MSDTDLIEKARRNKRRLNYLFMTLMGIAMIAVLVPLAYVTGRIFTAEVNDIFRFSALLIILLWFGGLSGYYAWAIYFYNINRGLTNESWAELRERRRLSPDTGNGLPVDNPHKEETLGLPRGTIRGTLALTLMVGGLALTIAALGMDCTVSGDTFIVDNFDFFKTAFLMMIAFYFGNKSLEMIGYKSKHVYGPKEVNQSAGGGKTPVPVTPVSDDSIIPGSTGEDNTGDTDKNKDDNGEFYVPGAVQ